ncbi:hypothetical protein PWEIH_03311 [Listeria weihenstephanensis FSL R9-0317]|uniref:Uncharacterized protein n=1 Tax=Listeria weihenstephanensis TaxID=1006155 RepID=A0A1S7FWL3_9LIST|nr:hypothetical protein [Listeria weihenstephanensis]AQY51844.1 hypothetical protein UE46_12980 [Listeria weihenstephanensis]EUJ40773.1 hypothetical protein PWEIH_03311 [Listeria weihenstephanensis FSL R9-0317]
MNITRNIVQYLGALLLISGGLFFISPSNPHAEITPEEAAEAFEGVSLGQDSATVDIMAEPNLQSPVKLLRSTKLVGQLKLWVTFKPNYINWRTTMYVSANSFKGTIRVTNTNSGLLHGNTPVNSFAGHISQPLLRSTFQAQLYGNAYYGGVSVGKAFGSGIIMWQIK